MAANDAGFNQARVIRDSCDSGPVYVNSSFETVMGLSRTDLEKEPLLDWIHPDDREGLARSLAVGEGCASARHRTRSGAWVAFDWRVQQRGDGTALLGLLAPELPLEAPADDESPRGDTLPETLAEMARIVERKNPSLRCSILLLDPSREHVVVGAGPSLPAEYNAAVEGLRIGPSVGSCGTAAFWNIPVVVESIQDDPLWADLRDAASIAGVAACWSQPIRASDGSVLGAMALYSDEAGAPAQHQMDGLAIAAHMVGLAIERDRLEQQLRQSAKLEALGVMAGGVAHDFNNMLTVILTNAELGIDALPHDPAGADASFQGIVTASLGAADLCKQMLAYAGRGALTTKKLELNELVEQLGGLLKVGISKKAELVYELCDEPAGVLADHGQIKQVILNLITNASEALGGDGGRIELQTSVHEFNRRSLVSHEPALELDPGEYVSLSVSDTGCGMDQETLARIFDPFFSRKSRGRGLGLAAVRGIIKGHGGQISVESSPGKGTTFRVFLPRTSPPTDSALSEASSAGANGTRVLVAEDEPEIRTLLSTLLNRAGYDVLAATDGEDALNVFRRESDSIACVLTDLSMPKLDGEELFHAVREIRDDIPVVLISGFAEQSVIDRFKRLGFSSVLQKPAKKGVLLETLAEVLAASE